MSSGLFFQELIRECQEVYYCKDDRDFPEIILINYPFSLMISLHEIEANQTSLINELQSCFNKLIEQDCEKIIIACNTLHVLLPYIKIPPNICLRIDDAVFQTIKNLGLKNVALYSTETTGALGLYLKKNADYSLINTVNQESITVIIDTILSGKTDYALTKEFVYFIELDFLRQPFEGIILGCTEFSLLYDPLLIVLKDKFPKLKIIDSTRVLVKQLAKESYHP